MRQNKLPKLIRMAMGSPDKVKLAEIWLKEVRERQSTNNPFKDSEWKRFCDEHGFTQWTYSSTINMLKQMGMVVKEKRVWRLSSLWLIELMKEWNEWLGVEYTKKS